MIAEQGAVRERLAQVAQGGLECRIVEKCIVNLALGADECGEQYEDNIIL